MVSLVGKRCDGISEHFVFLAYYYYYPIILDPSKPYQTAACSNNSISAGYLPAANSSCILLLASIMRMEKIPVFVLKTFSV